jgi:hypothetical protein
MSAFASKRTLHRFPGCHGLPQHPQEPVRRTKDAPHDATVARVFLQAMRQNTCNIEQLPPNFHRQLRTAVCEEIQTEKSPAANSLVDDLS